MTDRKKKVRLVMDLLCYILSIYPSVGVGIRNATSVILSDDKLFFFTYPFSQSFRIMKRNNEVLYSIFFCPFPTLLNLSSPHPIYLVRSVFFPSLFPIQPQCSLYPQPPTPSLLPYTSHLHLSSLPLPVLFPSPLSSPHPMYLSFSLTPPPIALK